MTEVKEKDEMRLQLYTMHGILAMNDIPITLDLITEKLNELEDFKVNSFTNYITVNQKNENKSISIKEAVSDIIHSHIRKHIMSDFQGDIYSNLDIFLDVHKCTNKKSCVISER